MSDLMTLHFYLKCKQIAAHNNLKSLIISDQQINSGSLLTEDQILISQYSSAMCDQIINPALFKPTYHYSTPVLFAMLQKANRIGNLQLIDRIITSFLRETTNNKRNKHIVMFNKVKILQKNNQIKKATFFCQNLLKQSGDGCDFYTYQFLRLLDQQGRSAEAIKIAERHLEGENSGQKHKVQSAYIAMLNKQLEKDERKVVKKLQNYFHNRNISIVSMYNMGILLKNKFPQKSLQIFRKITSHLKQKSDMQFSKISVLCKINIINIYQKHYISSYSNSATTSSNRVNKNGNNVTKYQIKAILEQCENLYQDLQLSIEDSFLVNQQRKKNIQVYDRLIQEIRNQSNANFLFSISSKKKLLINDLKFHTEEADDDVASQAKTSFRNKNGATQSKFFQEKRAQNEKRLKFLLNKEKQLKQFFQKLKVERQGSKLHLKIMQKSLIDKSNHSPPYSFSPEQFQLYETKFEEKKKQFKLFYEDEINSLMNNFIDEWITPYQKNKVTVRNAEKMRKFVITLECPNEQQKQKQNNEDLSKSKKKIKTCRVSQQGFRVKNNNILNTCRKGSEKMLQVLKCNDHISSQIVSNLKNNIAEKRKQDRENSIFPRKNFKQLIHEGQVLEQQNKLEEAHQHYTKMYKRFKQHQQKEILLLKIAENFEKLQFYQQAEKTYLKCTKFNSIQAFFRLGSLQIRNGKVQVGIQNLEKANCIDRHNIKIQVQLVYGYSLLEGTTQRALALANSILKRNPECLQALIMSSKILQKKGKLKQALDIAMAIGNTVKSAATYHYIGLLYINDSNVSEAYKYFHKALQCDPNHIPSLIQLATIISEAKPREAIQILKNVLSTDSKNQLAFARLGKIYETFQNDYESALVIYKKGLQSMPSYENFVKIGDCHLKKGSIVDSYLNYKEALALKATPEIYEKIAEVHQLQHQDKKAIEVYGLALAQLLKGSPNISLIKQKKYLEKLGRLSLMSQQFEAAYGYLSYVCEIQQSFDVLKMLGQACFGKGDYSEALNYYERASAMLPQDNLQILEHIAMCFDKQEQYLTSRQIYQKILSIDPKNIKCLNNLANILLIIGKTNEAFYWYQFMLQQSPNNLQRRLRVADIYATIGDWSKVQQHLTICHKQKQNDIRVIERMVNLYKEKRDFKQLTKFQKRLGLLKSNTGKNIN